MVYHLKELREEKRLSSSAVAPYLALSQQEYENYETGKADADHYTLLTMARFFECSEDFLLGKTDYRTEEESASPVLDLPIRLRVFKTIFFRLCIVVGKPPSTVCAENGLIRASKVGWTDSTLPSKRILLRLAKYFGVTPEYLLGEDKGNYHGMMLTNTEMELLSFFRSATETGRFEIIAACVNISKERD